MTERGRDIAWLQTQLERCIIPECRVCTEMRKELARLLAEDLRALLEGDSAEMEKLGIVPDGLKTDPR